MFSFHLPLESQMIFLLLLTYVGITCTQGPNVDFDTLTQTYLTEILRSRRGPYIGDKSKKSVTEIVTTESGTHVGFWTQPMGTGGSVYNMYGLDYLPYLSHTSDMMELELYHRTRVGATNLNTQKMFSKLHRDTLIVFTTSDRLEMTVVALKRLKESVADFDLIIVDNHSVDGTVPYLVKKGYFVVSKLAPTGRVGSLNIGFHISVELGYRYVIFVGNDVLVPRGAIHQLRADSKTEALVVPLTTLTAAGPHLTQVGRYLTTASSFFPLSPLLLLSTLFSPFSLFPRSHQQSFIYILSLLPLLPLLPLVTASLVQAISKAFAVPGVMAQYLDNPRHTNEIQTTLRHRARYSNGAPFVIGATQAVHLIADC